MNHPRRECFKLLLFAFAAAFPVVTHAKSDATQNEKFNCRISVTQVLRSGKAKTRIYKSVTENEAQCAVKAKRHEKNFFPHKVKSKRVRFKWG